MNKRVFALIIIGLCLFSLIVGIINTISVSSKKEMAGKSEENKDFWGVQGGNKIALINLEGVISAGSNSDGFMNQSNSAESVRKSLRRAYKDNSVKGILLRIDSPGGTVATSQEIYEMILKIRKKKPVVVSMVDLAASGGYYISSAADRIIAEPGTLTGSVGVIMNSMDASQFMTQKLGIKPNVIKSGKFKDLASPYRPMTPDERALLQNIINSTYSQFVNAIIAGRVNRDDTYEVKKTSLTTETLKKYADGRVLTGEQAKALGFVDMLGGIYEAQDVVTKMARQKFKLSKAELPLVQYNVPTGFGEMLFGVSDMLAPKKDLMSGLIPLSARLPHQTLFVWE
jgi:protease IV